MKIRHISLLLLILVLVAACDKKGPERDGRIALRACISDMQTSTKAIVEANPFAGSVLTDSHCLDADVWFSTDPDAFGSALGNALPCRSTAHFTGSGMTYPAHSVNYPTDGVSPAYCIGLYPQDYGNVSGWSAGVGSTTVSHPIDGVTDLMFAPKVSGTWNNPIATPLQFGHLLTWLKICADAHEYDAIAAWGAITEISIENPHTQVTVTLGTGAIAYSGAAEVLKVFEGSTDLKVTSQLLGSVLCAPATSYNITVKTTNFPTGKTVTVNLTNMDSTPVSVANVTGKVYVLTLDFYPLSMIDAGSTLEDWEDEYSKLTGTVTP